MTHLLIIYKAEERRGIRRCVPSSSRDEVIRPLCVQRSDRRPFGARCGDSNTLGTII